MKKLNKIVLSIGAASAVVAPIAAVVSCGSTKKPTKIKPNGKAGANAGGNTNGGATGGNAGSQTAGAITQAPKSVLSAHDQIVAKINASSFFGKINEAAGAPAGKRMIDLTAFEQHFKPAQVIETFINKAPDHLLALINNQGTASEKALAAAKFMKNDITVPFVRQIIKDFFGSFDPTDDGNGILIKAFASIAKDLVPNSMVGTGISFIVNMASSKVTGATPDVLTEIQTKVLQIFDSVDFDSILDKIIASNGKVIPSIGDDSKAESVNGFVSLLFGHILKLKDGISGETGIKNVLHMLSVDDKTVASSEFATAKTSLETDLPGFASLTDEQKTLLAPILVPLFEKIGSKEAGISHLDMNLNDANVKDMVSVIGGLLKSVFSFDLKALLDTHDVATMGYDVLMNLDASGTGTFSEAIKVAQTWLTNPTLVTAKKDAEKAHNDAQAKLRSLISADPSITEGTAAYDDQKALIDAASTKLDDATKAVKAYGAAKIQPILDWVLGMQKSLLTLTNNFMNGGPAGSGYVAINDAQDFYTNLTQFLKDVLSAKLPTIADVFVPIVQKFIPKFANGGSVLGLIAGFLQSTAPTTSPASPAPTQTAAAIYTN